MTLRRFKLLPSTTGTYDVGDPSGPIPVIEIDDATGDIYSAGVKIGSIVATSLASKEVLFSFGNSVIGDADLQFDPATDTLSGALLNISAGGGTIVLSNLPTLDPHVVNQLWNNAGVLTVSAG